MTKVSLLATLLIDFIRVDFLQINFRLQFVAFVHLKVIKLEQLSKLAMGTVPLLTMYALYSW